LETHPPPSQTTASPPELAKVRIEALSLLEQQSAQGYIDLFYGNETAVSELGYVPYGWQFADEDVYIPSRPEECRHYFGLLSRNNQFFYKGFTRSITS